MKKKKLSLLFISFFLFLIMPITAYADTGYKIENYKVDIIVNENNVLDITETIDVNFLEQRHGIIRKIPIKNVYKRSDYYTESKAIISNMKINDHYTSSYSDGEYSYKIGSASEYVTGKKQYIISYSYDIGDDNIDEYDELYYNIIGTKWDCNIENVEFSIAMPKDFDQTKINFPMGYEGATYYEDVIYNIDYNNLITGYIKKDTYTGNALNMYEGLTVRIELPKGYFVGARKIYDPTFLILIVLLVLCGINILIATILFFKYGKRDKFILVPEYTVPDDLPPAEIGYLYKGRTLSTHIVSLITYLANKGYLQIIDEGKNKFSLKRLKPIDDNEPEYARITFNGLCRKANEEGIVTKKDLTEKFYTSLTKALFKLKGTHKIYNASHSVCIALNVLAIMFLPMIELILILLTTYRRTTQYNTLFVVEIITFIFTIILLIIYAANTKKRKDEAKNYYNRIMGFKDYLEKVEKEKLELLVEENPNYFYDILPYAYVLGISNKWSKKFESITLSPPSWYVGNMYDVNSGMFNVNTFNNSLTKTLASTATTMSSRPYQSSGTSGGGGFHGGGGFSGGGGGGGGGSSW